MVAKIDQALMNQHHDTSATEKTRIMVVNDHLGWGNQVHGVTRLFQLWASYLPKDRYAFIVCVLNAPSEHARVLRERGCRVIFLPKGKYDPGTALSLARLVRREKVDILHLQGYRGMAFGKIAARLTGVPTVIHYHDTSSNYPLAQRLSDRLLGRYGSVHLAVSHSVRACWAERIRLPEDRIRVLYNCDSLAEYREPSPQEVAESRRKLGIPTHASIVGTVARLFPEKGVRYLIEAAPRVLEHCPATWFVIVGDGPQRPELEAMADALGLRERIRFVGYIEDVGSVLAAVDLSVLASSKFEGGSPLTVLESMFMGKPVIATNLVEIVEDGVTGLLIPTENAEALADSIVSVLTNPELSSRLGRAGQKAAENYDVRHYVEELGRIYDSLL